MLRWLHPPSTARINPAYAPISMPTQNRADHTTRASRTDTWSGSGASPARALVAFWAPAIMLFDTEQPGFAGRSAVSVCAVARGSSERSECGGEAPRARRASQWLLFRGYSPFEIKIFLFYLYCLFLVQLFNYMGKSSMELGERMVP